MELDSTRGRRESKLLGTKSKPQNLEFGVLWTHPTNTSCKIPRYYPKWDFHDRILLSPSGDLGIGLIWDNHPAARPICHFSLLVLKSSSKLNLTNRPVFSCSQGDVRWSQAFSDVLRCFQMFNDVNRCFWMLSRCSQMFLDVLYMFSKCCQDISTIFTIQDVRMIS